MAANSRDIAITLGVGLALMLFSKRGAAGSLPVPDPDPSQPDIDWDAVDWSLFDIDTPITEEVDMNSINAFLYAIRRSEHMQRDVDRGLDFFTYYGGSRFNDLRDHPVLTGEKQGIPLPDDYCVAAGMGPGCVSTAAGAFQINRPTWVRVRSKEPRIPDFSPSSQMEAARRLLVEKGADKLIAQGRIEEAVYRVAPIWASLPGSTSKQPGRSIADVMSYYQDGLDTPVA